MNKKAREIRNQHIIKQYILGASKKDLALLNNMTVQNINTILRNAKNIEHVDDEYDSDIKKFVIRMHKFNKIPKNLKPKNPRNITFKSKVDAEIILEKMVEFIILRGKASLARFYLINGMCCHKHDHFNGWTDAGHFIKNTKIIYLGPETGYKITLAPNKEIEYDMVNDLFPKDYRYE